MKMVKTSVEEILGMGKKRPVTLNNLQLELTKIRNRSPKALDALAAIAMEILLGIASMTKESQKRKAFIKAVETAVKAFHTG